MYLYIGYRYLNRHVINTFDKYFLIVKAMLIVTYNPNNPMMVQQKSRIFYSSINL